MHFAYLLIKSENILSFKIKYKKIDFMTNKNIIFFFYYFIIVFYFLLLINVMSI